MGICVVVVVWALALWWLCGHFRGGGGGVGTWVVVVVCMGTWVVVEQQVEGAGVWTACAPRTSAISIHLMTF